MSADEPIFSVIMATQNPGVSLEEALASVFAQQKTSVQVIVVDRGSTDGTAGWLERQGSRVQPILGAQTLRHFEALNQGLALAKGKWIFFMDADDRLVGDKLLSEVAHWGDQTEAAIISGEAAFDDGRINKMASRINPLAGNFISLSASFYRRGLLEENSGFDPKFIWNADYEFHIRMWKAHIRFKSLPLRITACRPGGARDLRTWARNREEIAVRHLYYPAWKCLFWDVATLLRRTKKAVAKPKSRRH